VVILYPYIKIPGAGGRILLRWIFRKWDWRAWTGFFGLWIGTVGGTGFHKTLRIS